MASFGKSYLVKENVFIILPKKIPNKATNFNGYLSNKRTTVKTLIMIRFGNWNKPKPLPYE